MKWNEMTWNDMKWHDMTNNKTGKMNDIAWNSMKWHEITWMTSIRWYNQKQNWHLMTAKGTVGAPSCFKSMKKAKTITPGSYLWLHPYYLISFAEGTRGTPACFSWRSSPPNEANSSLFWETSYFRSLLFRMLT
jgi:hypothetical protein